jgi:hypothetical protein
MRARLSLLFLCSLLFLMVILVPASAAQDGPDIFVTPVPNAPFHAFVDVQRSVVQRDGSVQDFKTYREIGRDRHGRIHNEARKLIKASSNKEPGLLSVHLYDPQTRISTMIDPASQTFWTRTVNHPPSTVPPSIRFAAPASNGAPPNEFTKEEDLGMREIEGVPAHGVRETQVIPAEASETGKEILITDEYWYSEDLRINLIVQHNDPRTESVTLSVLQIDRTEPDPSFFEIPDGYVQRGMRR